MNKKAYYGLIFIFLIIMLLVFKSIFVYNLKNNNIYNLTLILVIITFIYFISKIKKININKKYLKYVTLILIVFGVVLRILLLFNNYKYLENDYKTFYDNALAFSNSIALNNKYISIFPHIGGYIIFLGNIFKVFGSNYNIVIITNIIFDLIGSLFIYLTLNKLFSKKVGIIGLLIWLLNPMNIMFCSICSPVIIFNSLLSIIFYITSLIINNHTKKNLLLSLLIGILLGIANIFRPIIIIYIIALIIYYIYNLLENCNTKKLLLYIFSALIIILSFSLVNIININNIEKIINLSTAKNTIGWNLYVGSNIDSSGMWSSKLNDNFVRQYNNNDFDANKIQNYFKDMGLKRYINNGVKNISLINTKFNILNERIGSYTYNSYFETLLLEHNKYIKIFIMLFTNLFYFSFIILSIYNIKFFKNINNDKCLIYILFVIGTIISHLIMEVSPRYMLPLLVSYTLTASISIYNIILKK